MYYIKALEKEMATHSSTLAWEIPWTDKPGQLQSMGYTFRSEEAQGGKSSTKLAATASPPILHSSVLSPGRMEWCSLSSLFSALH